jgi:tRNA 2-selenouridine synthase
MPTAFTSLSQIYAAGFDDIIDVRSPAEYGEDHIPGAISLPALDNEERAVVGTIYTQESSFKARKIGAALVARNVAAHLEGPLADRGGGWRPLVYCWRGGQRSGSFAAILSQIGWRAEVVEGGYRSYRRLVVQAMHDRVLPHRVILLDGNTGTAKTEILALLTQRGVQVVDLEGLAAHRGSLFGAVAQPQPSQKAFEGALAHVFEGLDPARPVVIEAESSKVGALLVPSSLWAAMRAAPRIRLNAPLGARAQYLTRAYADLTADICAMQATLAKLVPLRGHEQVSQWQQMAARREFEGLAAELMAKHYDSRYNKSRSAHEADVLAEIALDRLNEGELARVADQIVGLVERA